MESLSNLKNQNVYVKLQHKIFGAQAMQIKNFQPIITLDEIGFKINTQFISFNLNDVIINEINNGVCISDKYLSAFITK